MKTTVHLLIKGRVQGVYYRATAKEAADHIGVVGWIRNTTDGDVECVVSGEDVKVQKFIAWCHQGPRGARVTDVLQRSVEEEALIGFQIKR